MLKEYKMQTILGVGGGVFFLLFGFFMTPLPQAAYVSFGRLMMAGGYILLGCGVFMYARGKGYSWVVGLCGLLGPLGLLILYVLRDRSRMVLKKRQKEES
jgi:hypothetical protein